QARRLPASALRSRLAWTARGHRVHEARRAACLALSARPRRRYGRAPLRCTTRLRRCRGLRPASVLTEVRGHPLPLHLAGGRARDALDEVDDARDLERSEMVLAVREHLCIGELGRRYDRGGDELAVLHVRDRICDGLGYRGMQEERRLYFERRDVLSSSDNDLLDSPNENQIAVNETALVPGTKPAGPECLGVRLLVRQVAG